MTDIPSSPTSLFCILSTCRVCFPFITLLTPVAPVVITSAIECLLTKYVGKPMSLKFLLKKWKEYLRMYVAS